MMDKAALEELLAQTEVGVWLSIDDIGKTRAFDARRILMVLNASRGSLDAAFALKDLLPDEAVIHMEISDGCTAAVAISCKRDMWLGESDIPSRAMLIAILKALIAQDAQTERTI